MVQSNKKESITNINFWGEEEGKRMEREEEESQVRVIKGGNSTSACEGPGLVWPIYF